jgi:hypothetical protein
MAGAGRWRLSHLRRCARAGMARKRPTAILGEVVSQKPAQVPHGSKISMTPHPVYLASSPRLPDALRKAQAMVARRIRRAAGRVCCAMRANCRDHRRARVGAARHRRVRRRVVARSRRSPCGTRKTPERKIIRFGCAMGVNDNALHDRARFWRSLGVNSDCPPPRPAWRSSSS